MKSRPINGNPLSHEQDLPLEHTPSVFASRPQNVGHEKRFAVFGQVKTACMISDREMDVLRLIAFGRSTKEIAVLLFLSHHTVTNHRKNMLKRSGCGNFAELVRIAIQEQLL